MFHQRCKMSTLIAKPPEQAHRLVQHLAALVASGPRHYNRPIILKRIDHTSDEGYSRIVLKQESADVHLFHRRT
jgi:hypothetical protein